ncbi:hypothetical protein Purlil1_12927 [Purpureocillium lilacinum]|uniref:Uncharacterized protein n=1 Tax=Purpureocillium lilacinum TaxID=33203 RepID=A0ABR0BFG5_PURLI|nr:hypothetical protein Purlil1_12927 [Purpureocillium lilacinum]
MRCMGWRASMCAYERASVRAVGVAGAATWCRWWSLSAAAPDTGADNRGQPRLHVVDSTVSPGAAVKASAKGEHKDALGRKAPFTPHACAELCLAAPLASTLRRHGATWATTAVVFAVDVATTDTARRLFWTVSSHVVVELEFMMLLPPARWTFRMNPAWPSSDRDRPPMYPYCTVLGVPILVVASGLPYRVCCGLSGWVLAVAEIEQERLPDMLVGSAAVRPLNAYKAGGKTKGMPFPRTSRSKVPSCQRPRTERCTCIVRGFGDMYSNTAKTDVPQLPSSLVVGFIRQVGATSSILSRDAELPLLLWARGRPPRSILSTERSRPTRSTQPPFTWCPGQVAASPGRPTSCIDERHGIAGQSVRPS